MNIRAICGAATLSVVAVAAVAEAGTQDKAQVERGVKVYAAQKCSVCHSIGGQGAKKGPLDGVGSKLSEGDIREWIVNAPAMTKKTNATRKPVMKNYAQLPKEDVDALVAYMLSLKKS